MAKYLVIVESPSKAKTIKKFLGPNYKVEASMGHLRDLPKSQLGVDVENSFAPKYINIRGKGELIKKLKKESKNVEKVFLATDPDREGEAISWHLSKILGINEEDSCRVTFNEITKDTVKKSIKMPRQIDMKLVDAQQARRVLDRIVGYKISPLLWKNVKKGLSAGRVQSVAVKLICDRENEINQFEPEEYWTLDAIFKKSHKKCIAKFYGISDNNVDKKIELKCEEDVENIKSQIVNKNFIVSKIKKSEKKKSTPPPFTTSTLQQESYKRLGFTAKKTMIIAQQLYEGIDLKDGTVGLITYMRTDSVRLSDEAKQSAKDYIRDNFGVQYIPKEEKKYKAKASAQDAHEAIRPSDVLKAPDEIKSDLTPEQYKLYNLIWVRFLASQMENAVYNMTSVEIRADKYIFKLAGSILKFDGFLKIYYRDLEDENMEIPELSENEILNILDMEAKQHFTQPPARFTDASIVKILEEKGVGRPSTYVPTIETIIDRGYVLRDKKILKPTELGEIVNRIVCEYFTEVLNVEFTANMEKNLDEVEAGSQQWNKILEKFYESFSKNLEFAEKNIENVNYVEEAPISDVICEKCGRNMVIKLSKFGKFLACPGFPECRNTKSFFEKTDLKCPKCHDELVQKFSKKRIKYYSCVNEECKSIFWGEPTGEKCPECGDYLIKANKNIKCNNSKCKYKKPLEELQEAAVKIEK